MTQTEKIEMALEGQYGIARAQFLKDYHKEYLIELLETKKLADHMIDTENRAWDLKAEYENLPPGGAEEIIQETLIAPTGDGEEATYTLPEMKHLRELWRENFPEYELDDFLN